MKILFLTPELPYPPDRGASIRSFNLIRQLALRHEVSLLSFQEEGKAEPGPLEGFCHRIELVTTPLRSPLRRFLSLLLSPLPDMAHRLPSPKFEDRLKSLLGEERFELVQVESIEMARYISAIRGAKVVFDDLNAEYLLQRRAFERDLREPSRWLGALYSLLQWRKLKRYETQICRGVDRVIAVSEADREALLRLDPHLPVRVVKNGVDADYYRPTKGEESDNLVFVGKMDFRPNVEGVLWFFQKVWPRIKREKPQARFWVVGRDPSPRLSPLASDPQVTVTGFVPDVRPYIARATLYVVPLQVGGGTRLKVLEAMAMGKAIVSTSLGCEGIEVTGQEVVIADEPQEFAQRLLELWENAERRNALGVAARRLAESHDWRSITPTLERVYGEII